MNRNPYLEEFLQFYSQADAGNGLTRGLETDLAKRTYVRTKLDEDLTPAVLEGKFRLVILTGNAGDGKTAFIQTVEKEAENQGAVVTRIDGIGSEFHLHGIHYQTLYDGSVETEHHSNFEMLNRFFDAFEGDQPPQNGPCLLVAMNEGKLRDFLGKSTQHPWLSRCLLDYLLIDTPLPDGYIVVNLNLRTVVDASHGLANCLLDHILDRYVAHEFWEPCEQCVAKQQCPIKFNVDSFRFFPTAGLSEKDRATTDERNTAARAVRVRLKALFQVLHFRKRLHVTVRDLRSALAFTLFGKKSCAQIIDAIKQGQADFFESYYYNAIFAEQEKDRVIGFIREFDVGKAAMPQIDSRLSFTQPKTSNFRNLFLDLTNHRLAHCGRNRTDEEDLFRLFESRPRSLEERTKPVLDLARQYVVSVRRKLFFEGSLRKYLGSATTIEENSIWAELLPFDRLQDFISFVETAQDPGGQLKVKLVEGISRSEGIYHPQRSRENICIRTRQDSGTRIKAFFTYPATDFSVEQVVQKIQAHYIEYLPASITFRHLPTGVSLEVSLDLYEMLMRIRDGYVPTAGEMRAFFLNLLMFKKQLMALPAKELLLTETDYQIYKLIRTPQNGVALSTL